LLAQAVLEGKTKGYRNHPQLNRFYAQADGGIFAISTYLHYIARESDFRGYKFNRNKFHPFEEHETIPVTTLQIGYELALLEYKISVRKGKEIKNSPYLLSCEQAQNFVHPLFHVVPGKIENWEKVKEFGS
jgi:hypothetical protein